MSVHGAFLHWSRGDQAFDTARYSRRHEWVFDGGARVAASSSPQVVPVPASDPSAVDPEEAFVASLSSCHLLWFLSIAADGGWVVDDYQDRPEARLGRDPDGGISVQRVTLRPVVRFGGGRAPDAAALAALHDAAHHACFLARSVRSEMRIEPQADAGG